MLADSKAVGKRGMSELMAALRPDAAKRRELAAKVDEAERALKKKREVQAKERKRVRELEAEKRAKIEEELVAEREAKRRKTNEEHGGSVATAINAYLDSRPFFGHSDFEDKDAVKHLCIDPNTGKSTAKWDHELKLWGTYSLAAVQRLVNSELWFPIQIQNTFDNTRMLLDELEVRIADESVSAEDKSEMRRQEAMAAAPERVDHEAEVRKRAAMQCELDNEEEELTLLAKYALDDPALLQASVAWNIGPLFGISAAGRLVRMLIEHDAFVDPDADEEKRRAVAERIKGAFAEKRKLVFGDPTVG
jgi:hypothetical protein